MTDTSTTPPPDIIMKPIPDPELAPITVVTWQTPLGRLAEDERVTQAVRPSPQADARNDDRAGGWADVVRSIVERTLDRVSRGLLPVVTLQDWGWGKAENLDHYPAGSRHPRRDDMRWSLVNAYMYGSQRGFCTAEQVKAEWKERAETLFPLLEEGFKEAGVEVKTWLFDYESRPIAVREQLLEETTYSVMRKVFGNDTRIGNWDGGTNIYMPIYYDFENTDAVTAMCRRHDRITREGTVVPWILMPGEVMSNRATGRVWTARKSLVRFFWRWLYLRGVREFFCWQTTGPDYADWEDLADIIEELDLLAR
jgi:hypothetical protein